FAAAAGRDFNDILRESLGKTGEGAGDNPEPGFAPVGQIRGDDVAHDAARDEGIGLIKRGAAGVKGHLRGQSGGGRGVSGRHGSVSMEAISVETRANPREGKTGRPIYSLSSKSCFRRLSMLAA